MDIGKTLVVIAVPDPIPATPVKLPQESPDKKVPIAPKPIRQS
jgi:hypothetical protein